MDTLPLIIEPETLLPLLNSDNLILVDLCSRQNYLEHHIPGAIHLEPSATQRGMPPAPGMLPSREQLQGIIDHLGLDEQKQVVVYDDEGGGWAGRFIWLLDCIGFSRASYLNGGLITWANEGHPLTQETPPPKSKESTYAITDTYNDASIQIDELIKAITTSECNIWDARSAEEHQGLRSGSVRAGHIPGAFNFEWTQAMDPSRHYRLKPLESLRKTLLQLGLVEDKPVVTHCQTHHRSGLTYLISKALGYDTKAYDGSWSEWGNRKDTPIK